jgi:hypothetical protein
VGVYGGVFYCNGCTLSFDSSTFKDNVGYNGGIVYMLNTADVTFTSVTMTNGRARHYGGAIYSGGSGASTITFSNCASTVATFETDVDGGFMYIDNPDTVFSSSLCDYNHMLA